MKRSKYMVRLAVKKYRDNGKDTIKTPRRARSESPLPEAIDLTHPDARYILQALDNNDAPTTSSVSCETSHIEKVDVSDAVSVPETSNMGEVSAAKVPLPDPFSTYSAVSDYCKVSADLDDIRPALDTLNTFSSTKLSSSALKVTEPNIVSAHENNSIPVNDDLPITNYISASEVVFTLGEMSGADEISTVDGIPPNVHKSGYHRTCTPIEISAFDKLSSVEISVADGMSRSVKNPTDDTKCASIEKSALDNVSAPLEMSAANALSASDEMSTVDAVSVPIVKSATCAVSTAMKTYTTDTVSATVLMSSANSVYVPGDMSASNIAISDREAISPITGESTSTSFTEKLNSLPIPSDDVTTPQQDSINSLFSGQFPLNTPEIMNIETPLSNIPSIVSTSECAESSPKTKKKIITRKDSGRIRRRHTNEWIDIKRKKSKNSGQEYTSRDGKKRDAKLLKPPCTCKTMKCQNNFTPEQRQALFERFWKIGDHTRQWDFISKHAISVASKKIKSPGSRRSMTVNYTLPSTCADIQKIPVCKRMFLNTLSISERTVYTALEKTKAGNGSISPDKRGHHVNHPIKITQEVRKSVHDHINSLAPVESHYCRKNTSKLYLDGDLNFVRLYNLYNEWINLENYGGKATQRQYQDIVNDAFNIEFYIPKKDQCDKCHIYKNLTTPTEDENKNHEEHQKRKDLTRCLKEEDKQDAIKNNSILTATFDMQKVLTCPFGQVSVFYYMRKLSLYNFTVYVLGDKCGYCYMWNETSGKKGANEICSGLYEFMKLKNDSGVKEFRFWSDSCSGQNRNRIVFSLYMYMVENYNIERITHRFFEVGHSQSEGDSVHALIERASKNKLIYTPDQWYNIIRWAKKTGSPYTVMEMTHSDILNFRTLLDNKNWEKNSSKDKVLWSQVREILVTKSDPNTIKYKYDLAEKEHHSISVRKIEVSTRRRRGSSTRGARSTRGTRQGSTSRASVISDLINTTPIPMASNERLKIDKNKFKDLMNLCENKIIPQEHHRFFKSLPYHDGND